MTHKHLSFQCLHRLKSNAHDDDNRRTADRQVLHAGHQVACHDGQTGNDCQVDSTEDDDLINDLLNEVRSGLARTEAGDEVI